MYVQNQLTKQSRNKLHEYSVKLDPEDFVQTGKHGQVVTSPKVSSAFTYQTGVKAATFQPKCNMKKRGQAMQIFPTSFFFNQTLYFL